MFTVLVHRLELLLCHMYHMMSCPNNTSYVYQTCKLSVNCRMYALQTLCGVSNVSRSLGCSRPYRVSCNHITTCLCVYTRPWANPLKLRSAQQGFSACTTLCNQHVQVIQSKEAHNLQCAICAIDMIIIRLTLE